MTDLGERLERLGLSQYLEVFVSEGFDTWETILDITESDLNSLNVKLGHRRKLQRAIAEYRGQSHDRPLPIVLAKSSSVEESQYRSDDSTQERKPAKQSDASAPGAGGKSTKRKYRRHPKPDEHAPERPPSAYVIFSNQMRETLRGQELSFTEIAKVVGERWQVLSAEAREVCERQANSAKEKYYAELAEYKKTPQYEAYQKYLEDFKAKHQTPAKGADGKRSKLETETSFSTRSSSHEQLDRTQDRRFSQSQPDSVPQGHHRSESSPPMGYAKLGGQPYPTTSASPANHPLSGFNSPRMMDHYSPVSASPMSATLHKESSFDFHPSSAGSGLARDARERNSDPSIPTASSTGYQYPSVSTTPPQPGFGSQYQNPLDLPSRRSFRDPTRLPPLTHEDTTLSSDSGNYSAGHYSGSLLPVVDAPKSLRLLPQPVPSLGPITSPLDQRPPQISPTGQPQDFRPSSSMAALLRAGELARVADDEEMDKDP